MLDVSFEIRAGPAPFKEHLEIENQAAIIRPRGVSEFLLVNKPY